MKGKTARLPAVDSLVVIVPEEHHQEVVRRIEAIRAKDQAKRLEYDCEKLKESVAQELGVVSDRESLQVGKRYGVLLYSKLANAVRHGEVIPYHGEIYLAVWTYYEDGKFYQQDAWGGVHESNLPGCPLVELQ